MIATTPICASAHAYPEREDRVMRGCGKGQLLTAGLERQSFPLQLSLRLVTFARTQIHITRNYVNCHRQAEYPQQPEHAI